MSRVSPLAPNSASRVSDPAKASTATKALMTAEVTRPEAAMCRARGRCLAPSARDTAAVIAIVSPMLIAIG